MDRTDEVPQRYWVIRAFSHFDQALRDRPDPTVIRCGVCGDVLMIASDPGADNTPLLMYDDLPICPGDALVRINQHPITPTYLKWLDEGDPRWWSQWFCDCDGCGLLSQIEFDTG